MADEALEHLKREFLALERRHDTMVDALIGIVHTLGAVVDRHDEFKLEYQNIKELLTPTRDWDEKDLKKAHQRLRRKVYAAEVQADLQSIPEAGGVENACRLFKRTADLLLEDFYPLSDSLQTAAGEIAFSCREQMDYRELEKPAAGLLNFLHALKKKINDDFSFINSAFLGLLEQVQEVEKSFAAEFADEQCLNAFKVFESKVDRQFSFLLTSFDVHSSIGGIKAAVSERLEKIKSLLAERRKAEISRVQKARKNILKLQRRIADAEQDARTLSQKAVRFQEAASKDGLTGLFNRGAFDRHLREALQGSRESGESIVLIVIDVDKFKEINDTLGHVAGDKILRVVAETLLRSFRKDDFIARYGGDEFAVISSGLDEKMARERIEAFNAVFSQKKFFSHALGRHFAVSLSAGIASSSAQDVADSLIHRADQAMYAFKKMKKGGLKPDSQKAAP